MEDDYSIHRSWDFAGDFLVPPEETQTVAVAQELPWITRRTCQPDFRPG